MTLHKGEIEVGVRELHDRLSEHLEKVEQGVEIIVTRRGKPIARLGRFGERPLEELVRRGLVRLPNRSRTPAKPEIKTEKPISEFIKEQRR
jgi:antitoxin (DNA-binding transcriptional repressor) of toxin-antitoxin stability system